MKPITIDDATYLYNTTNSYDSLTSYYHNNQDDSDEEFIKNVINEDDLDDWTIDDLLQALPKSINYNDKQCDFRLKFISDYNYWEACYENNNTGDSCISEINKDRYNVLINLFINLNNNNLL